MSALRWHRFRALVAFIGLSLVTLLVIGAAKSTAEQAATAGPSGSTDSPAVARSATPAPGLTPQLLADSAFPTAEVIHVVAEANDGSVTETWADQVTGDVVRTITDRHGGLRTAHMRHGLTMSYFGVLPGGSSYYIQNEVLAENDPYLSVATDHLDGVRRLLERGMAVTLGEGVFHGQPAIKVRVASGELGELIVYVDPETLYPLGIVGPNGAEETITYRTIETLRRADAPTSAFQFTVPATDSSEISDRLTAEEIAQFTAYPLLNLGPAFGDFKLEVVDRYQASTKERGKYFDETTSTYRARDDAGHVIADIQVKCRGPRTDQDRADTAKAEQDGVIAPAELVTVNGQPVQLRHEHGGVWLEIERPAGSIYLLAPDRETALAAAAALQPAVAAPLLIPPPIP